MKEKLIKKSYLVGSSNPDAPSGLRIAVLSDFHNGDHEAVLAMLSEDVPDAIAIPGDLVLGYFPGDNNLVIDRCAGILTLLKGCSEIAPSFMSVGNHECLLCDEEYDIIRGTGTIVLDNEWTEWKIPGRSSKVLLGGLTSAHAISYRNFRKEFNDGRAGSGFVRYPYRDRPRDINKVTADNAWLDEFCRQSGYRILLSHHPEYWAKRDPMLRDRNIDLVLSGHAHGGQWAVMGRGLFAPGQGLFPVYTRGVHEGPHGAMVISRGLSNPYRAIPRLGNPCELVYVEIDCRDHSSRG